MPEMTCENCKSNPATGSAVIGSHYYKYICDHCRAELAKPQAVSSGAADYNRTIDMQDHEADVQQPFAKGVINDKFVAAYPEKAVELFGEDAVRNALR